MYAYIYMYVFHIFVYMYIHAYACTREKTRNVLGFFWRASTELGTGDLKKGLAV